MMGYSNDTWHCNLLQYITLQAKFQRNVSASYGQYTNDTVTFVYFRVSQILKVFL